MTNLIDLKRLQHFLLLGEELHFTRAAERANLSQTAFSRSIQTLESEFSLRLFDRGTRSVVLTAAGKQLLEHARKLLNDGRNLLIAARDIQQGDGGELSFGAGLMAANSYLHKVLPQLRNSSPRLRLNVEINHWKNLYPQLIHEHIEFFVSSADELIDDPRLLITPLPAQPAAIFCRPEHPLLGLGRALSGTDIATYPWAAVILNDALITRLRSLLQLSAELPLAGLMSCNDTQLLRATTLHSDTLLFSWSAWLQEDLAQGNIVNLMANISPTLPEHLLGLNSAVVCLAGRSLSPAAQRAIQLICAGAHEQATSAR